MSADTVELTVDGRTIRAERGMSLAAAMMNAGVVAFRVSVSGEPRGPLCGMGICFECRVSVNGVAHQRACLIACEPGLTIATGVGA